MRPTNGISNNEMGTVTRPTRGQITLIIDLTFSPPKLVALDSWIINEEVAILSDHKQIVFNMANLDKTVVSIGTSLEVISWVMKAMSEEETEEAQKSWQECTAGREILGEDCNTENMEQEAV